MGRKWRSVLINLAILVASIGLVIYGNFVLSLDVFARYRMKPGEQPDPMSVRLQDVDVREWHGDKLMTFAHAGSLNIGRNQNFYEMYDVRDGLYRGANEPFTFEATHLIWTPTRKQLEGRDAIHIASKRLDFRGPGFVYDSERRHFAFLGTITGKYEGANFTAGDVAFDDAKGELSTGATDFEAKVQEDDSSRPWKIHWTHMVQTDKPAKIRTMTDIRATDGTIVLKSPKAVQDLKTDVLTCEGPVHYWSPKADAICDKAIIYRKEKRAVLIGNVTMVVKPKDRQVVDEKVEVQPFTPMKPDAVTSESAIPPSVEHLAADTKAPDKGADPKGSKTVQAPAKTQVAAEPQKTKKELDDELRSDDSIRKYPATVFAQKIEYFYAKGSRHAIITGSPQAQQELPGKRWRRVWADHGLYNGEDETLRLFPAGKDLGVVFKSSIGDDLHTDFCRLSTEDGNSENETGNGDGVMVSEEEDANEAARKAGSKDKQEKPKKPSEKPANGGPST